MTVIPTRGVSSELSTMILAGETMMARTPLRIA
jgi:hypothetical protein